MKKIIISILLVFVCLLNTNCSEETAGQSELPSLDPTITDGIQSFVPLFLKIGIKWESDTTEEFTNVETCQIAPGTAEDTSINCSVSVPEGQLYYSDVRFDWGTMIPEQCKIIEFFPYSYQRSVDAAFLPPGVDDPIDCSEGYNEKCWGGAAVKMVENFPKNRGLYILPEFQQASTAILRSEGKTRHYSAPVNYLVTNNLMNRVNESMNPTRARIMSTWIDYSIGCYDEHYEHIYSINITFSDENFEVGDPNGVDDRIDWD